MMPAAILLPIISRIIHDSFVFIHAYSCSAAGEKCRLGLGKCLRRYTKMHEYPFNVSRIIHDSFVFIHAYSCSAAGEKCRLGLGKCLRRYTNVHEYPFNVSRI